jgi:SET domain-containing protein
LNDNEYHKVIANNNIQKGEILLIEYPEINLFGENEIDKGLQLTKKYIELNENELYPRNNIFLRTNMIKNVHKIIKNTDKKLKDFFSSYSKDVIEMYYAKYIFNAFEGFKYGPLTLPMVAKFNHSCNPNIEFKFNEKNGTMIVTSIKNIKKGSEVFDSYLLNKNLKKDHNEYLYEHYGFVCNNCF